MRKNKNETRWLGVMICFYLLLALLGSTSKAEKQKVASKSILVQVVDITKLGFVAEDEGQVTDTAIIKRLKELRKDRPSQKFYGYRLPENAVELAEDVLQNGYKLRDITPLMLKLPLDWGANPHNDKNWHFQINALRPINNLLYADCVSADTKYIHTARAVMLDWIDYNLRQNKPNKLKWHDMGTGLRADKLAYLIDHDLHLEDPNEEQLITLILGARIHADLLRFTGVTQSNHGLFQMIGLAAICHALPEMKNQADYLLHAQKNLIMLLGRQFNEEGIHLEHSTGYHLFVYRTLLLIDKTGYFSDNEELQNIIDKAAENIVWLFHPNGDLVMVGDSERISIKDYEKDHPYVAYAASEGAEGSKPPEHFVVFPKAGYAMLRSDWDQKPLREHSFLYFAAAYHSKAHKHPDDLTFEWSEFGVPIIVDSGKYSYSGSKPMRGFFRSRTHANNTVEIDGRKYPTDNESAYGSALRHWGCENDIYSVDAEVVRPYWALKQRRIIFIKMREWLCVVDLINAQETHTYTQWFHFHEDIEAGQKEGVIELEVPGLRSPVWVCELAGNTEQIKLVKGQTEPRYQGWISPRYEELLPRYTAGFVKEGTNVIFVTLFSLREKITRGKIELGKDQSLKITWTDSAGQVMGQITYQLLEGKLLVPDRSEDDAG